LIRLQTRYSNCALGFYLIFRKSRAFIRACARSNDLSRHNLAAECDFAVAVDAAGGALPLPDGRTVTVGRAEFDALLGVRRKRAWVIIRKSGTMLPGR
jgi:hypothetical protein